MSPAHQQALQIPFYANGSLAEEERRELEAHLKDCEDCRSLLDGARLLRRGGIETGFAGLDDHPQALLLLQLAEGPESLEQEVRSALTAHLESCDLCREAVTMVRRGAALPDAVDPAAPDVHTSPSTPTCLPAEADEPWAQRLWHRLSGGLLRPAPALAYLVIAAVGIPWLWLGSSASFDPEPRAASATPSSTTEGSLIALPPAIRLQADSRFRGTEDPTRPAPTTPLPAPGAPLALDLDPDLDPQDLADPGARFEVRLASDELRIRLPLQPSAFDSRGALRLLVRLPEDAGAGLYTLTLHRMGAPPEELPLFERRIRLLPGTSEPKPAP